MPGIAGEDSEVVTEASALGSPTAASPMRLVTSMGGTTMGEAIGSSRRPRRRLGTPGNRGETGGGDPNR
jgi:hypothetical protein